MAHFAKISEEKKVLTVLYIENKLIEDENGAEQESIGHAYFRGNYAGVGITWYAEHDAFLGEKPYASWVVDSSRALWTSPIGDPPELTEEQVNETLDNNDTLEYPNDSPLYEYQWDEANQTWNFVTL